MLSATDMHHAPTLEAALERLRQTVPQSGYIWGAPRQVVTIRHDDLQRVLAEIARAEAAEAENKRLRQELQQLKELAEDYRDAVFLGALNVDEFQKRLEAALAAKE